MFTLIDSVALLAAIAVFAPLILLPGVWLGMRTNALQFRAASADMQLALAALLGLAIVPSVLALASTLVGLPAAAAVAILFAAVGATAIDPAKLQGLDRHTSIALAVGAAVLTLVWIDIEWAAGLYQSLLTLDVLKHAAITRSIVDAGVTPPPDPFFAREGSAVFYYFYFVWPAIVEWLTGSWIHSRAAVGGILFWTAVGFFGLVHHVYRASGLRGGKATATLLTVLVLSGGLQIISALLLGLVQASQANQQVTPWAIALVWVPHHVAAFMASWIALLVLSEAMPSNDLVVRGRAALLAAAALASAAGMSVWVTVGVVLGVAIWSGLLLRERRFADLGLVVAAGVASLVIALPYLHQILSGATDSDLPVGMAVRSFVYGQGIADAIADRTGYALHGWIYFALLPLNYLHECGLFLICAAVYWLHPGFREKPHNDVATLLTITTVVSFLVGSFFKSTISNNDLGWRVMMFAQLGMLAWTAHVLWPAWQRTAVTVRAVVLPRRMPRLMRMCLMLGLSAVGYDFAMLRLAHALPVNHGHGVIRVPAVDRDQRRAYEWLATNVPRDKVLQHNPDAVRAVAFALYGRHPVGVADLHNPFLLGAQRARVLDRLADIIPIFKMEFPVDGVVGRARKHGIDLLVVTANDPIWKMQPTWLAASAPVYENAHVRVIAVNRLKP